MHSYRAAPVGCGRMGAFIDSTVAGGGSTILPYSHAAGYEACARTGLVAGSDMRADVLDTCGDRFGVLQFPALTGLGQGTDRLKRRRAMQQALTFRLLDFFPVRYGT